MSMSDPPPAPRPPHRPKPLVVLASVLVVLYFGWVLLLAPTRPSVAMGVLYGLVIAANLAFLASLLRGRR
jgi:hypothetical protein